MGGVCQQVGQYSAQQGQGDLLHVQAEDAVEQLHHTIGPLLSSLLQQLLKRDAMLNFSCILKINVISLFLNLPKSSGLKNGLKKCDTRNQPLRLC